MTRLAARLRAPSPWVLALLGLYAAVSALAVWQALEHATPAIFTDELELAELGRSIAETGRPALRGEAEPLLTTPLFAWLSAPAWWIDDVPTAYGVVKLLSALVMASVVFPAYGIARLVAPRGWSLFAAAGAGLTPALAYAPILVKEPTAYPASTLALWLVMRWVATPSARGFMLAAVGCALGLTTRSQLAVLFAVLGLSALAVWWRTPLQQAWRLRWTRADWLGAVVLGAGAIVLVTAAVSRRSGSWYVATTFYKDRMFEYGLWAAGALALGIGVVPLVAGLAALVPRRGDRVGPGVRAFTITTVAALGCFGLYAAVKAAYLSTVFAVLVLERNLIYLVPLLFAGTALFLQRAGGRWWAVAAAGALTAYLVVATPYQLESYPYYEAHGLSILAFANRVFVWPEGTIEHVLLGVVAAGTVVLLALPLARRRPALLAGVTGALAVLVLSWTTTAEVYAARGEERFADRLYATLPKPVNWLDRATGGEPVTFLGQAIADPNPIHLLEFWNRSVSKVWALDGTAPPPGPTATPNLDSSDGTLTDPHTPFAVTSPGVDLVARPVGAPVGGNQLYRLPGTLRLRRAVAGVYPDGWMGGSASYAEYAVPPGALGFARVTLSREGWCGEDVPGRVTVRVGPVAAENGAPTLERVTQVRRDVINACERIVLLVPAPAGPWKAEVTIEPTFSPRELDPSQGDARQLGATVSFGYDRLG